MDEYECYGGIRWGEDEDDYAARKITKAPREYKSGKDALAYNPNYHDEEILELYLKGMSYQKIADRLGIRSKSTVKIRMDRIKERYNAKYLTPTNPDAPLPF